VKQLAMQNVLTASGHINNKFSERRSRSRSTVKGEHRTGGGLVGLLTGVVRLTLSRLLQNAIEPAI